MRSICLITAFSVALTALLNGTPANAFKIDPWSYRPFGISPRGIESQLESFIYNPRRLLLGPLSMGARLPAAMGQLKEPVHENLTELSLRCALAIQTPAPASGSGTTPMITRCPGRAGALLNHADDLSEEQQEIIRAVRFNDAPPVKLATAVMAFITPSAVLCGEVRVPENAGCWAMIMAHAAALAASDPGNAQFSKTGNFLYRTHFGDMQFMHAMAASGETVARTQERVLLWMRFTYQVAVGEIDTSVRIDSLAPEFARDILAGFEDWTVAQFFEIRGTVTPGRVRRLALGALLHTIQDSFAHGHTEREAQAGEAKPDGSQATPHFGAIRAFLNYGCQSDEKHADADRAAHYPWFGNTEHDAASPVTLGAQVIDLALTRKLGWNASSIGGSSTSVAQWMRAAVFPVVAANAGRVAGAGTPFLRTRTPASAAIHTDANLSAAAPPALECSE